MKQPNKRTIENAFPKPVEVVRESPVPGKQGSYHVKFPSGGDDNCVTAAQKLQDTYGFYCNNDWRSQIYDGHLELIDPLR